MAITGVILAGGRGTRMGGRDKGLINYQGRPLIEHLVDSLTPQVDEIIINANRNFGEYKDYGHPIAKDQHPNYWGPLAGIQAGLSQATHELVVFAPVDAPHLSESYVSRMTNKIKSRDCSACYAKATNQLHPTHVLVKREYRHTLDEYLLTGQRKVRDWLDLLDAKSVDFSDIAESFTNINFPSDLV